MRDGGGQAVCRSQGGLGYVWISDVKGEFLILIYLFIY